ITPYSLARRKRSLLLRCLLLTRDRTTYTLVRPRIRMRPLTTDRQTPAMTKATITADVHQPLHIHRDLGPQRTLDLHRRLDRTTQTVHLVIRQLMDTTVRIHTGLSQQTLRGRQPDPVYIRERDLDP